MTVAFEFFCAVKKNTKTLSKKIIAKYFIFIFFRTVKTSLFFELNFQLGRILKLRWIHRGKLLNQAFWTSSEDVNVILNGLGSQNSINW